MALSDPMDEFNEMLLKGRGTTRGVGSRIGWGCGLVGTEIRIVVGTLPTIGVSLGKVRARL